MLSIVLTGLMASLCGCSMAGPIPSEYVLGRVPVAVTATKSTTAFPEIEIERVRVPDYLDTTDIIERRGDQLIASSTGRWGERLSIGMTQALTESLSAQMPCTVISSAPTVAQPASRILVNVMSFAPQRDGYVVLVARWTIVGGAKRQVLMTKRTSISEPLMGKGDPATVASMNLALKQLAEQIGNGAEEVLLKSQMCR